MKIVISGPAASGKSSVAKLLAQKLGYRHFSMGDVQRDLAKRHGIDWMEWHKLEASDEKYDRMVDEHQTEIGQENDDFVIDSWLGACFIPDAFKVWIDAPIRIRVQRRLHHKRPEEDYGTPEEVEKNITARENMNRERWKRMYRFDYKDMKNYDLVVDTSKIGIEQVVDRIGRRLPCK
jgi:CMP/dCMP kinase